MPHAARERTRTRRPRRDIEERARPQDEEEEQETRSSSEDQGGPISELRGVMSEAAVTVLAPVAKKFATQAAKMAVERGPDLLEGTIMPKLQDLGGKFGGGDSDDDEGGGGKAGD